MFCCIKNDPNHLVEVLRVVLLVDEYPVAHPSSVWALFCGGEAHSVAFVYVAYIVLAAHSKIIENAFGLFNCCQVAIPVDHFRQFHRV